MIFAIFYFQLALQSLDTFIKILKPFVHIVPGCLIGGDTKKSEKRSLRKGINVILATPGRLLDHIRTSKNLELGRIKYLVIDEADRLLELGFEQNIKEFISVLDAKKVVRKRQTILLSATLSPGVEKLAGMALQDPERIDVSRSVDESEVNIPEEAEEFSLPRTLKQHFIIVPSKLRLVTLTAFILKKCKFSSRRNKLIIFLATTDSVDFHYTVFAGVLGTDNDAVKLYKLHGDVAHKDVAARGLDLPGVTWIIQYNTPGAARDYIHRVGRTARIGTIGHSLLFLTPAEVPYVASLQACRISVHELKLESILDPLLGHARELPKLNGSTACTAQECASALQGQYEALVQDDKELRSLARKAYQSFVRAYAAYPVSLKHIFYVKNLHLGHVAKSFALQDKPKHIGELIGQHSYAIGRKTKTDVRSHARSKRNHDRGRKAVHNSVFEYGSGLKRGKLGQKHLGKKRPSLLDVIGKQSS